MSTKRVLNLVIWAVIAAVMCTGVVYEWKTQAAPVSSLVLGASLYLALCVGFGLYRDRVLKEREGNQ